MKLLPHGSYRIDGARLLEARLRSGLTQRELGRIAGYTERVIRKGERLGHLSGATITDLVQALSICKCTIEIEDLLVSPLEIARLFMGQFEQHNRNVPEYCSELFDTDFIFVCAGNAPSPLGGDFRGREGFQRWLDLFFGMFSRARDHQLSPNFTSNGATVLVRYHERVAANGLTSPLIWVNLHFEIAFGLITRITDEYDTQVGLDFYLQASRLEAAGEH